jgi:tocopherol cyclase
MHLKPVLKNLSHYLMLVGKRLRSLFNPEIYQGWGKKKGYFEGWYFKILNLKETSAFAIIPGIAMDTEGNRHSFIQVLDGKKRTAQYHKFTFESFNPDPARFIVSIENNHFSEDSISLDLPGLKGKLFFSDNIPWPKTWFSPGIMGPYSFVPFMECYHGIVSMNHSINGQVEHNGIQIDFNGGRGYTEKDWGTSFPEAYIWIQSNHFSEDNISVKLSVARIPWLRGSFTGFIAGVWLRDRLIQFTTYNSSGLKKVRAGSESVEIEIENKNYRLLISAGRTSATSLASPIGGFMDGRIEESMSSVVDLTLIDRQTGISVFSDKGRNSAVEVAGKIEKILI